MTNPFEPSQKGFHPEPFVGEAFWLPCSRTMPQPTQNYKEELRQVKKDSLDYRGRHRASAKRPATLFASNVWTHAPLGDRLRLAILDGSTRTRVSYRRQPKVGNSGAECLSGRFAAWLMRNRFELALTD